MNVFSFLLVWLFKWLDFRCVKVGIYSVFSEFILLFEVGVGDWGWGISRRKGDVVIEEWGFRKSKELGGLGRKCFWKMKIFMSRNRYRESVLGSKADIGEKEGRRSFTFLGIVSL